MSRRNKNNEEFYTTYQKVRRDWGEINPSTKVIEDKKHKIARKAKHKFRYGEDF